MRNIRKGKDIRVIWKLTTNSQDISLSGRDITIELSDVLGVTKEMQFTANGNIVTFVFLGIEQKHTGNYTVTAWENRGKIGQNVVDKTNAFRLVPRTELESGEDDSNLKTETIDLGTDDFIVQFGSGDCPSGPGYDDTELRGRIEVLERDAIKENDVYNLICDTEISTPTISRSVWSIYKQDGTQVSPVESGSIIRGNNIETENGFVLRFEGKWMWTMSENRKSPTRTDGDWGTTLPDSGVDSNAIVKENITGNSVFRQYVYAKKSGVTVSGNKLSRPTDGEDSSQCSVNALFSGRYYYGLVNSTNPDGSDIMKMGNSALSNTRERLISGITNDMSTYFCYAYPSSLGALTSAKYGGSTQILEDFIVTTVDVTNKSGKVIPYYAYTFKNLDAFKNAYVEFK